MVFRQANKTDAARIAQLHAVNWQQNYRGSFSDYYLDHEVHADRLAVWQERLRSAAENQYIVLAEEQGDLLGFCCAYFNEHQHYGTYLDNLHVSEKASGKGIASRLIQDLVQEISNRNNHEFYLWVLENNQSAISFYDNLKGQPIEAVEANDIGDAIFIKIRYVWKNLHDLQLLINAKLKGHEH